MIETLRPILEIIYFVTGGPFLTFLAFKALKQIEVAKEVSRTASKREAYKLASEQVHFFTEYIVPAINDVDKAIKENDAKRLLEGEVVVENDLVTVNRDSARMNEEYLERFIKVAPAFMVLVNRLEAFSVFFISGVAAESIAYSSVGATFDRTMKKFMPLILPQTSGKNYDNLMRLFVMWHNRLEKERLVAQSSELKSKLNLLQSKKVIPVGTAD